MKDKSLLKNLVIALALIACLAVFYATGRWVEDSRALKISKKEAVALQQSFGDIEVRAQTAFALDLFTGKVFYSKAENDKVPIASLTKIMTALVALNKFDEETIVPITPEILKTFGDEGLKEDDEWRAHDLIKFMLISSSNDAAMALSASYPGDLIADMNAQANELGLTQTFFFNETGLDMKNDSNYGSAKEMAFLLSYAVSKYPEIFQITAQKSARFAPIEGSEVEVSNTNSVVDFLPRTLASKTGFTARAGGSLILLFEPELNHPVVMAVLGSTMEDRFWDIMRLGIASLEYFNSI